MKPKTFTVLLLPAVLFLQGCFSMMTDGDKTPKVVKSAALAADLVTLPGQAAAAVVVEKAQESANRARARQRVQPRTLLDEIKDNPEHIFTQKLDLVGNPEAMRAVSEALWDSEVNFTDAQLRRLYQVPSPVHAEVLRNPHCSEAFLREVFATLPGDGRHGQLTLLLKLIDNRTLPLDLLETIANDENKYGPRPLEWARNRLERRKD
ncbi:MAG: hypothetical protein RL324_865 [Verrucomicrobiota bacterium]|jgi:hypothetical protein